MMDYRAIEKLAGKDIAQKLEDNDYYDNHISVNGKTVSWYDLDDLTRGAVIIGVDLVDYPLVDGCYIYMKRPAGDVIALLFEPEGAASMGQCRRCGRPLWETLKASKINII